MSIQGIIMEKEQCNMKKPTRVTAPKIANSWNSPMPIGSQVAERKGPQLLAWYCPQKMVLTKNKSIEKRWKDYFSKCKLWVFTHVKQINKNILLPALTSSQINQILPVYKILPELLCLSCSTVN